MNTTRLLAMLPLIIVLCAARCVPPSEPAEGCTGNEDCGTDADCHALCEAVERLGCAAAWGVDGDDGACLELCQGASPSLCPRLAAKQPTCEAIERATECGR